MRSLPTRPPLRSTKPQRATNSSNIIGAGFASVAAFPDGTASGATTGCSWASARASRASSSLRTSAGSPCARGRSFTGGGAPSGTERDAAPESRVGPAASDSSPAGCSSSGSRDGGFTRPSSLEVSDASRLTMSSSPRCSAFLFGFSRPVIDVQQFLGQPREVEIPGRLLVVLHDGLARARRLRQLDVLVDGRAQHQRLEEALDLLAHLAIHLLPLVVEVDERADDQIVALEFAL